MREPREIEQCIGCATTVAVYSDRQLVAGEAYCPACRRAHREHARSNRRSSPVEVKKSTPDRQTCTCEKPDPLPPPHADSCRACWYKIEDGAS